MTNHSHLLHELVLHAAERDGAARALTAGTETLGYAELADEVERFASGVSALGLARSERVAIYLEKRLETVIAMFGTTLAGGVFVPVNPLLKAEQVAHILSDCNVRVLVTSPERVAGLGEAIRPCHDLQHIILVGARTAAQEHGGVTHHHWTDFERGSCTPHRVIDTDMAAILYTSGSTGRPKGVVLSHRNMVAGAKSVAHYLGNHAQDTLLAALPLSFDAGLSQLTTAFHVGARVVLLNYLMPRDVLRTLADCVDGGAADAYAAACDRLGLAPQPVVAERAAFEAALQRLAGAPLAQRLGLLAAGAVAVSHDGGVEADELETLRLIGAALDCPLPPLG